MSKPIIGITMGDPAGVGPELCLRVLADPAVREVCVPRIFGNAGVLNRVAEATGLPGLVEGGEVVECFELDAAGIEPGKVQEACGVAAYGYIREAARAAQAGEISAMATAPVNKQALNLAGIPEPGHTEILAALTGTDRYCMMMAAEEIKVSLATVHVGYADVPDLLTKERVLEVIELTDETIKRLGMDRPKIAVCALNPHAGEHGLFGEEETRIIGPAIEEACAKGIDADGPFPPDTAFIPRKLLEYDAHVVMYHDQGLIPFKMLAFDRGVNITLGLPIVRTSVDHGTAFDIAWQGKASATSLVQSVLWAIRLTEKKN